MSISLIGNLIIALSALITLGSLIFRIRKPFKNHKFNTFSYIMLLLFIYSLIGNYCSFSFTLYSVRMFYFLVDLDNISARMSAFLLTYPIISNVIISYTISNLW
jgi:hypothetical protein